MACSALLVGLHGPLVTAAFGARYAGVGVPLAILGGQLWLAFLAGLQGAAILAGERVWPVLPVAGVALATVVALDLALVPPFGAVGASAATGAGSVVMVVALGRYLARRAGLRTPRPAPGVLAAGVLTAAAAAALAPFGVVGAAVGAGLVFVVVVLATGAVTVADLHRVRGAGDGTRAGAMTALPVDTRPSPAAGTARASCVVVAYHRPGALRRLLVGLRHPHLEVLVVNVEDDPAVTRAARDTVVVPLTDNPGYAAAVNVGVAAASAPVVVFMNDDVVIASDAVLRLANVVGRGPVDVAVPQVVDVDGAPVATISAVPSLRALAREWLLLPDRPVPALVGRLRVEKWRAPVRPEPIEAAAAVVVAARRTLLDRGAPPRPLLLVLGGGRVVLDPPPAWRPGGVPHRRALPAHGRADGDHRLEVAADGPQRGALRAADPGPRRGARRAHRRAGLEPATGGARHRPVPRPPRPRRADPRRGPLGRRRRGGRRGAGAGVSVLLVDWLGRGGIAQTTAAWAAELDRRGHPVTVVTRAGRELAAGSPDVVTADGRGPLRAHRAVAAAAGRAVRDRRPDCVVVQNYVVPPLETALDAAVAAVGARLVVVVHDDRLHSWRAGTGVGLTRRLRHADVVVAHTEAVAQHIAARRGRRDVVVVPHPAPVGLLAAGSGAAEAAPDGRWAAHFGVLRRRYKGTAVVEALAGTTPGWTFLALGVGAPLARRGLVTRPGYVAPGALVDAVAASDATVLPYAYATQSGAVVLAQALGSVPVVERGRGDPRAGHRRARRRARPGGGHRRAVAGRAAGPRGRRPPPDPRRGRHPPGLAPARPLRRRRREARGVNALPRVSVLVVTRDEPPDRLGRALAAVRAQDYRGPLEVLVAAPPGERPVPDGLDLDRLDVELVDNPGGQRSAGLNRALARARGPVVVRVDARSVPPADYVTRCVARLAADPTVGVVGAVQRPTATAAAVASRGIARALRNPYVLGGARYRRPGAGGPADTAYLGAFRADELRRLGGYDERLAVNEDFDLCARYRAAGWQVWVEANLAVGYEPRPSHGQLWRQYETFGAAKARYWRVTGARPNGRQLGALIGAAVSGRGDRGADPPTEPGGDGRDRCPGRARRPRSSRGARRTRPAGPGRSPRRVAHPHQRLVRRRGPGPRDAGPASRARRGTSTTRVPPGRARLVSSPRR